MLPLLTQTFPFNFFYEQPGVDLVTSLIYFSALFSNLFRCAYVDNVRLHRWFYQWLPHYLRDTDHVATHRMNLIK